MQETVSTNRSKITECEQSPIEQLKLIQLEVALPTVGTSSKKEAKKSQDDGIKHPFRGPLWSLKHANTHLHNYKCKRTFAETHTHTPTLTLTRKHAHSNTHVHLNSLSHLFYPSHKSKLTPKHVMNYFLHLQDAVSWQ